MAARSWLFSVHAYTSLSSEHIDQLGLGDEHRAKCRYRNRLQTSERSCCESQCSVTDSPIDWRREALRPAVVSRRTEGEPDDVEISGDEESVLRYVWNAVEHQFGLIIGEYDGEIVPVEMLLPLADFLVTMTHATPTEGTIRLPWKIFPAHAEPVVGDVEVELNAIYNRIWDVVALLHRAAKANQEVTIVL